MVDPIDDTDPRVRAMLVERWRAMTPTAKLALMDAHSVALQELSMAGLRRRFPDADEREIELRAAALRLGIEEFAERTGHRFEWP